MSRVRIALRVTVEVDAELWDADYGTGFDADDIRADVLSHVETAVGVLMSQTDDEGMVTVRLLAR